MSVGLPMVWDQLGSFLPRSDDAVVWHHTNAAGLVGVVEKSRLWASSPLTLNDASELSHGMRVVDRCWRELRAEFSSRGQQLLDGLLGPQVFDKVQATTFLLCATKDRDSLNQWQHYSGDQGFALGIRIDGVLAAERRPDVHGSPPASDPKGAVFAIPGWYDVIYDPDEQRDAAEALIRFLTGVADRDEEALKTAALPVGTMLLGTLVCRLKHPAFKDEREVRYLAVRGLGNDQEFFRQGPRGLVPFLKLGRVASPTQVGQTATQLLGDLPLHAVVIGPSDEPGPTEVTLRRLLDIHGYTATEVGTSAIPYRF